MTAGTAVSAADTVRRRTLARELLRRRYCQESLLHFALSVDIPGVASRDEADRELPAEVGHRLPRHHEVLYRALEDVQNRPFGRLLVMMPPGAAKSTCANVAIAWDMARPKPAHRLGDTRILHVSYSDPIAHKQSGRIRDICNQPRYRRLFAEEPVLESSAAGQWGLSNGSEMVSSGILSGISGIRASGVLIDDPVKNRKEADSEAVRQTVLDEYQDTILPRLLPGGYVVLIMTRWSEQDLAGSLLPEKYDGASGLIRCRDGLDWRVLNVPACSEREDDPVGRRVGEYLWPEWFPAAHWAQYSQGRTPEERRRWFSLYQQRPSAEGAGLITRQDVNWYDPGEEPAGLWLYGASDYATLKNRGDFTEHGVCGLDAGGQLWLLDWWSGQETTDVGIEAFCDLVARYRSQLYLWAHENNVLDRALEPAINRRMRERRVFVKRVGLPSVADKVTKVMAFNARLSAGTVWLPRTAWAEDLLVQLLELPAGRYDDKADVAGLLGRMIDRWVTLEPPKPQKPFRGIRPFTAAWLEAGDTSGEPDVCYR